MRLIEHDQCVGSEEAGVVWPHLAGCPVALEEKPGADHIDGAHDDGVDAHGLPVGVEVPLTRVHL